ncbi:MAG: DUF6232 family protein [Bacteroidota bacterium]
METIIYSDTEGVKITAHEFITQKRAYNLNSILKASIKYIRASFTPALTLILVGILAMLTGFIHIYSSARVDFLSYGTLIITANRLAIFSGVILLVAGIVRTFKTHDKYVLHLSTIDGEQVPVKSKKKAYIKQVAAAIQKALSLK